MGVGVETEVLDEVVLMMDDEVEEGLYKGHKVFVGLHWAMVM